jgi:hypothetical protein
MASPALRSSLWSLSASLPEPAATCAAATVTRQVEPQGPQREQGPEGEKAEPALNHGLSSRWAPLAERVAPMVIRASQNFAASYGYRTSNCTLWGTGSPETVKFTA